jgi:hypothetical protein
MTNAFKWKTRKAGADRQISTLYVDGIDSGYFLDISTLPRPQLAGARAVLLRANLHAPGAEKIIEDDDLRHITTIAEAVVMELMDEDERLLTAAAASKKAHEVRLVLVS